MAVLLDPSDCFQDSPLFRQDIELVEQSTERFSEAMKKVAVIAKKCADAERGWSPPHFQLALLAFAGSLTCPTTVMIQ